MIYHVYIYDQLRFLRRRRNRDLKPENLIFASKAEDSDLLIADFGLSRIIEEDQFK